MTNGTRAIHARAEQVFLLGALYRFGMSSLIVPCTGGKERL